MTDTVPTCVTGRHANRSERVPVEPLRRAFYDSGLSLSQVCCEIGWTKYSRGRTTSSDVSRLSRALGIKPEGKGATRYTNHRIGVERALRIAAAIGVDPQTVEDWLEPLDDEPAAPAADGHCPECGDDRTWTDSWNQQRCERCWAIVGDIAA